MAKVPKQTREDLVVELAKIRDSHAGWVSGDENRRKEFAKAFGWNSSMNSFTNEVNKSNPTWPEIFVEVGRLLNTQDFKDLEGRLSSSSREISELSRLLEEERNKNKSF